MSKRSNKMTKEEENPAGKDLEMQDQEASSSSEDLEPKETLEDDDDSSSQASDLSLSEILKQKEQERIEAEEARERAEVVPALLMHAYHLPGYNWRQDWWQYLSNNHPLFGIWCHHRHHPIKCGVRIASLIGSVLFGLAMTNIIYLAFVFTQHDPDKEYMVLTTNVTKTGLQANFDETVSTLSVTTGNIALWTVGSLIHGFYDNTIWALAACSCLVKEGTRSQMKEERLKRFRSTGAFLVNLATIVVVAIATFACMLRAAMDADATGSTQIVASHQLVHGELQQIEQNKSVNFQDYEFVISYLVELVLSYIVYYPLVGTLLFSGLLNCGGRGRFPVLGGRPYEIRQMEEKSESHMDVEEGVEVKWKEEDEQNGEKDCQSSTGSTDTPDVEDGETNSSDEKGTETKQ